MATSIPITPSFGQPKEPWADNAPGAQDPGPIVSPPSIGVIGGPRKAQVANRNKGGNSVMRVGKK